ncbi:MAG: virulence RhuM family protein [Lachnospiraceae bacterium]|nr:virulence RhuM family protein [Lachnospiraceae bacterium]
MDNYGEIVIYQTEDGLTKLEVKMEDETVWLTQQQMAELFQTSRTNVVDHIKNVYEEGELDEDSTCQKFRQVRMEGTRYVAQLDSILTSGNRKLLTGSGNVSHDQAMKKAKQEYRKYQEITLSPVEEEYLKSIKGIEKEVKKKSRKANTK